jgi:hypothetical protein
MILAHQRLRAHLRRAAELAGEGSIMAARMQIDDAMSTLDDIQGLLDLAQARDPARAGGSSDEDQEE